MVNFVFDCGRLDDPERIKLRVAELDEFEFCTVAETAMRLPTAVAPRVPAALEARRAKTSAYLFNGAARVTDRQRTT